MILSGQSCHCGYTCHAIYIISFLVPVLFSQVEHMLQKRRSPVEVTRITASHALLTLSRRLLLLWRLVRLIRLISTLRRRCLLLLLLLRWRWRTMLRHRWLLCRVHARRALERHALHLRAQIGPLLLLLRWDVWLIAAYSRGDGDRVSVVDGRLVAASAEFLRVA